MPVVVKCESCGFIFYKGNQLKSVDDILRLYGYRCPCCLSIIESRVRKFVISLKK